MYIYLQKQDIYGTKVFKGLQLIILHSTPYLQTELKFLQCSLPFPFVWILFQKILTLELHGI